MNYLENSPLNGLIGTDVPILQAPMAGGASTPEMAAAVSEAGGLGFLALGYLPASKIREEIRAVRGLTDRPFGVNLFILGSVETDPERASEAIEILEPFYRELGLQPPALPDLVAEPFDDQISAVLDEGVPVFSFTFGIPDAEVLTALKAAGTVVLGTATTVEEGRVLADRGVDAVIAQGTEAGGHRGTFLGDIDDALLGLVALVPQMVDAVSVPVVAAGGIMDARGVVAALALGAAGVQMGTAFLTARESGINDAYRLAVLETGGDSTRLTRAFSGWPARGIQNRFMTEMAEHDARIAPFPMQNALTLALRHAAAQTGRPEFLSLWAGQAAALAFEHGAGEFVRSIAGECDALMTRIGGNTA